jgi:hypothetical protein
MLRLEDVRTAYQDLSAKASDIIRQLSLAAIALIWLFRVGTSPTPMLSTQLLRAAFFVFLALFFDLLQYLIGTATWHIYFRAKERAGAGPDEEFKAPAWINWPTWILFWLKALAMLIAYIGYVLPFLINKFVA